MTSSASLRPAVRRAVPADAGEIARLRQVMFASVGVPSSGPWVQASERVVAERLAGDPHFAALVVDAATGLAACGIGWVEPHLPSPANPHGDRGIIASMSTDPAYRRRGYATAILHALLAWFQSLEIRRVDLLATADGERLYRAAGFTVSPGGVPMTWGGPAVEPLPTGSPDHDISQPGV